MTTPRTTTVTLPGGIRRTTETRTVSVVLLPFIRSRKVYFRVEGLMPNTRHRPLFDDVDVSDWCKEEAFQRVSDTTGELTVDNSETLTGHPDTAGDLISDSAGVVEGSFYIPNTSSLRFRAGRREFKLRDWNATSDSNAISKAFASYTAQGTLETRQTTVTTIFPPPPPRPPIRLIDPIAQSFIIERPEGAFITSVDLFMQSKDSVVPLQVQIRPMVNGTPTNSPVPGARKFIAAADVNVSASPDVSNVTTITNVEFDAPIFLDGFQEYAVVLLAETDAYNAWTAVMTEFEVGSSTNRIMKQPSMGSFFKSQNGSTWTPDQSRDLMFRLKRANFTTGSGTANFYNLPPRKAPVTAIEAVDIAANPTVRVYCADHNLTAGSSVTLSGIAAGFGIAAGSLNTTHTVVDAGDADSFTILISGDNSTSTGFAVQTGAFADRNIAYSIMYPTVNQMVLPATSASWSAKATTGESIVGGETPYVRDAAYTAISVNENVEYTAPRLIAGATNQSVEMAGDNSLELRATLSTSSSLVSPVIDLSRLSASLIKNRVDSPAASAVDGTSNAPNNYTAETDPVGGSALAKHLTSPVTLEAPGVGLKVIFAANRPAESEIELYYRTNGGGDTILSETYWTLATIDNVIQSDDNLNVFREYRYTIDNLDTFDTFQFKVVFKSTNDALVPRLRDFRAIALGT